MQINQHKISIEDECYLIAEIGHNHQGEESLALKLVEAAAESGAHAVKFQKRNNTSLFTKSFYESEYKNTNSFGETYGKHRDFLEPKLDTLKKINELTRKLNIDFIMTVFDIESLNFCETHLSVDAYKIQSADLTYLGLIESIIACNKPFFISCGASSFDEIKTTFQFCYSKTKNFCLMYAVSSYPCSDEQLNLKRIQQLKNVLNFDQIGYSCHSPLNKAAEYARIYGAIAIEKHFTLDHSLKGPDHHFSSSPEQLKSLSFELNKIDLMGGIIWTNEHNIEPYQLNARYKMGKCAVAKNTLKKGTILEEKDILFQSPAQGINPMEFKKYLGKTLTSQIEQGTVFLPQHFE
ncbi:MAG: N-acetylneuraminate synthase family protein [Bacteroidia bacterium]